MIDLPIEIKINQYYENVKDESNLWVINNKLVDGIESQFIKWDIPLYTSLAYVDCTLDKLRPLCDYFSWLFLIDDVAEKLDEKQIWYLFKGTLEIIEFNKTNEIDIWSITFLNIWKRMNMNAYNKRELLFSKKEYIQGVINQKKVKFNIETYIQNRNMDVGSMILSTLLKHAYDIEIDKSYTSNISKIMGYCFGLSNDIYSFKNENSYNIINIIIKEKNCSIDESINMSIDLLNFNINMLKTECELNNLDNNYLNGLKYIVTATIYWTNNNPRYNHREYNNNIKLLNIKNNIYEKNKQNFFKNLENNN